MNDCTCVATFHTTHAALCGERLLKQRGIDAKLIPPPRNISADCTVALRFRSDDERAVRDLFHLNNIEPEGYYPMMG